MSFADALIVLFLIGGILAMTTMMVAVLFWLAGR